MHGRQANYDYLQEHYSIANLQSSETQHSTDKDTDGNHIQQRYK